jgi:hypothetical protein
VKSPDNAVPGGIPGFLQNRKNQMDTTELVASATQTVDGITGHTSEVDGQETKQSSLFRGTRIKFGKTAEWEIKGSEVIDSQTRLIFIDVARIVTRWGPDKKPAETIVLKPGEKFPDIATWNDKLPHTEWIMGLNGLRGPWQSQQIVYFLDPRSMAQFHWPDGTTGGSIAIIIRQDDKAASWLVPKGDDGRFDFYVAMNRRNDWHDLE